MAEKPIVVVGRKLPPNVEARLARDYRPKLNPDDRLYSSAELLELCADADAILPCHTEHLGAHEIARLPASLRIVANFSVGVDHCDLGAAKARGIVVTNTPDVLSDATAEIAILCMLGAARRASEGERLIRADLWKTWSPAFMVGTQVTGKRLGIVGMGRVGRTMARRVRGLDMEVHYHNRRRLAPEAEAGAIYHARLEELLPLSDVLSLHCPAIPETLNLMNAERLALLPEGAILVNTARGAIVDEDALIVALGSGRLAAAGLDVYKNEPGVHPGLAELDNTFLLPHVGSATKETRNAMGFRALDNLDAFFAGREPGDRVA
ncbi:MAG: 2-hydroxyacid dehydrogenase [Alphaproteobacteria bacterium]